jgi:hypothetical protein
MILRIFSKTRHRSGRFVYGFVTVWFLYFLSQMGVNQYTHPNGKSIFYLLMTTGFFVLWIWRLSGRLVDLNLSRLWVIPYLFPLVAVALLLKRGPSIQLGLALVFAFVVQIPLMLLPSRRTSGPGTGELGAPDASPSGTRDSVTTHDLHL